MSESHAALSRADNAGLNSLTTDKICQEMGAKLSFSAGDQPLTGLWRTYQFKDGSLLDIHANGCSAVDIKNMGATTVPFSK